MNKLQRITINSGALDATGAATAYSIPVRGRIRSVKIDYPADVCEVNLLTDELVEQTILDLSSDNTDRTVYPRTPIVNNAATAITYDGSNAVYDTFDVHGRLKLVIASGTEDDEVTVHVLVEEY